MNEFCNEMKLGKPLKEKIKRQLEYNSNNNSFSWIDKKSIFDEIPVSLVYEVIMNMNNKIISEINFFHTQDDKYFISTLVPLLKPRFFKAGQYIW